MTVKIWRMRGRENHPQDIIYSLPEARKAYKESGPQDVVNTTCSAMCNMEVLEDGNRLILVFPAQEVELKLGMTCISGRMIRPGLNLERLLHNGEFTPEGNPVRVCHIFQLEISEKNYGKLFTGLAERIQFGIPYPNISEYTHVYDYVMSSTETLEDIFRVFQGDLGQMPGDFRGHSLSVSDVLIVDFGGACVSYFCDTIGFADLDHRFFMKP